MKVKSESEVAQSCPTLSDPMDCSPPGSSIHGVFQARVLDWGAIAFSARSYSHRHFVYSLKQIPHTLACLWIFRNTGDIQIPGPSLHEIWCCSSRLRCKCTLLTCNPGDSDSSGKRSLFSQIANWTAQKAAYLQQVSWFPSSLTALSCSQSKTGWYVLSNERFGSQTLISYGRCWLPPIANVSHSPLQLH